MGIHLNANIHVTMLSRLNYYYHRHLSAGCDYLRTRYHDWPVNTSLNFGFYLHFTIRSITLLCALFSITTAIYSAAILLLLTTILHLQCSRCWLLRSTILTVFVTLVVYRRFSTRVLFAHLFTYYAHLSMLLLFKLQTYFLHQFIQLYCLAIITTQCLTLQTLLSAAEMKAILFNGHIPKTWQWTSLTQIWRYTVCTVKNLIITWSCFGWFSSCDLFHGWFTYD